MKNSSKISLSEAPYILYRSMRDPLVPRYVKFLVLLLLAYILSPIDLIPDFIPVFGLLDEAIIVPLALKKILSLLPNEKLLQYRKDRKEIKDKRLSLLGIVLVIGSWCLFLAVLYLLWQLFN